jgi:hypothetical protein
MECLHKYSDFDAVSQEIYREFREFREISELGDLKPNINPCTPYIP